MTRSLDAANVTEMSADPTRKITFVKLEFDSGSGTQFIHDSLGTFVWGGFTWLGVGDLGTIGVIQEGEQISPYEITMALSGLDVEGDVLDEALNQNYMDDPVSVYIGFMDSDHVLVADPDLFWSGRIDQLSVVNGEANVIQLTAESDLAIVNKSNDALYSDANLQAEFSGDDFFKYIPQMKNLELVWGGNTVAFNTGGQSRFGGRFGGRIRVPGPGGFG